MEYKNQQFQAGERRASQPNAASYTMWLSTNWINGFF